MPSTGAAPAPSSWKRSGYRLEGCAGSAGCSGFAGSGFCGAMSETSPYTAGAGCADDGGSPTGGTACAGAGAGAGDAAG